MLGRYWKKRTLRLALACLVVAFLPWSDRISAGMDNLWRMAFQRPFSVPPGSSLWTFHPSDRSSSPPGWTCGEDAGRYYFALDTGVRTLDKNLFPPFARLCDSLQTPDTLLPDEILLPDTVHGVRDTLLPDTSGLDLFVDSLEQAVRARHALFLRRHLARNVQGGEVWGDRAAIFRSLRDPEQFRLLLRLLQATLSDGIRLREVGKVPVAFAPADDPDSCRAPGSDDDLDGPCVRVRDTAATFVDSSEVPQGTLSSRYAVLMVSRGGDSTLVPSTSVHPSHWKVRATDGRTGWISSKAIPSRDDPGLCLSVGRTRHGWRITSLRICGEED